MVNSSSYHQGSGTMKPERRVVEYLRQMPETYKSLTIGKDIYTVYDFETEWGIMRMLRKNGQIVGAMRRSSARALGLLLGGDQLLTVDEYAKASHTGEPHETE